MFSLFGDINQCTQYLYDMFKSIISRLYQLEIGLRFKGKNELIFFFFEYWYNFVIEIETFYWTWLIQTTI